MIGLSNVITIGSGYDFSFAVRGDGTGWSWGNNMHGQLGDSTHINSSLPIQIKNFCPLIFSVSDISVSDFKIFPNPTSGVFTIDFDKAISWQLYIYNLTGELIVTHLSKKQAITLDFSVYPKGIYFINIHKGDGIYFKKLVIQ